MIPDIFAVEACGSLPNLLDKRSRFAPSTHSLMAVCPVAWLLAPITPSDPTPRWVATGVMAMEPVATIVLPVRDIRVMYALKNRHYKGFAESQIPHPHEYFVPMDALVAKDGHRDPAMQSLVARASATANFFSAPPRSPRMSAARSPGHGIQHAPAEVGAVGAEPVHTDLD